MSEVSHCHFHVYSCSWADNQEGSYRYTTNCFEDAISLMETGRVDVKPLISHVYPLENSLEAFQAVHAVKATVGKDVFKVVISDEKL